MTTYFEKLIKEASQKDMEDILFVSRKKEEVVYEVMFKSKEDEQISVAELTYEEGMKVLEEILEKAGLIFQKKTSQLLFDCYRLFRLLNENKINLTKNYRITILAIRILTYL